MTEGTATHVVRVLVPVTPGGAVSPGFGRAHRVAVATVRDGQVDGWVEHDVGWDTLHDQGNEGAHHARVARFLRENSVDVVVAGRVGPGMQRMLTTMGIRPVLGDHDHDARRAVAAAVAHDQRSTRSGST